MPEFDDELARLRAADPLDAASLPSTTDRRATELFERITMAHPEAQQRQRPPLLIGAAAVSLLFVGAVAFAVARSSGDSTQDREVADRVEDVVPDGDGAITPGGSMSGSCVEFYDLTTLEGRETAFDGTLVAVDGDRATFTVNQWFRGGDGTSVTLAGASVLQGNNSAQPGASLTPGTRLLVAGDGGFAWSCGFTQPYDAAVAQQWMETLRA